ncbi:MAG: phosphoribosylformylglycinamidine synthase subunit PurS [Desulfuromonadia bacterium]
MIRRIETAIRGEFPDPRGERVRREIHELFGVRLDEVRSVDVYTIDADIDESILETAMAEALCDPVIQLCRADVPVVTDFDWSIEVSYRPGVTDNVGRTAREALENIAGRPFQDDEKVFSSTRWVLWGTLTRDEAELIADRLLANSLIQKTTIVSRGEFAQKPFFEPNLPRVTAVREPQVREIDLDVSDDELLRISREGVLALSLEEMKVIQGYFRAPDVQSRRREVGLSERPTDVELECLAQTWSEHCKHKIFSAIVDYDDGSGNRQEIRSLFKSFIQKTTADVRRMLGMKDYCLSVFKDNAGVIRFTDDWSLVFKVETHNSPSALDPYGGALTGIVGVNRDPFGTGKGAKLIFNTDVFCFASPFYDKPLPRRLLHPRRIFEGVVEGVEHGGNKSGIPTVNGSIVFDDRFAGKPLVFCGTAGIMPREINGEPGHEKSILPGDLIVMTGGRIGKDGIHGATFSSEELHEESPVSAVQIGDPITQKRMFDFLIRARDMGLYRFITDNGAGGLSSSVGEMCGEVGGCRMDLARAPLKYAGLDPWEILISEAQERMSLAVPPDRIDQFLSMAREYGVEATVLGEFTDSGYFHILYGERTVAYLPVSFMHDGLPPMRLPARWTPPRHPEPDLVGETNYGNDLFSLLSSLDICSKESVVRRYDHEVQGGSVVKPLTGVTNDGPSDAAVVRPLLDRWEGVVVAHGISPRYSDIDTRLMAMNAVDEAVRNYVAVGGSLDLIAGLDNFCWCDPVESEKNPDGAYKMAQLVRANQALYEICTAYRIPLISGKDSMKNDYHDGVTKISIPPTILFSVIGRIDDVRQAVTMDVKRPGDLLYLLGVTRNELGGSEYLRLKGWIGNDAPVVDPPAAIDRYRRYLSAVKEGIVASCHDLSDGGLVVAAAESAFAGGAGMTIDLTRVVTGGEGIDDRVILFSESASRLLVTVSPRNRSRFESLMGNTPYSLIGEVTGDDRFRVTGLSGETLIDETIDRLKHAWQKTLEGL